jgi:hypothetical protein
MPHKPHSQSVTSKPCGCRYLESAAAEPGTVIVYDDRMGEYQLKRPDGSGSGPIYHCPFCGGAAPKSKRASFFARVTWAEVARLKRLTAGIKTVAEAIDKFGTPQQGHPEGMTIQTPASDTEPSKTTSYRVARFTQLSKTADVDLIDYGVKGIKFTFQGKYLGDKKGAASARHRRDHSSRGCPRWPRASS